MSLRRDDNVRRILTRSSLARPAHIHHDSMEGIAELRAEMIAGMAELRAEMIARFERVDRRLDESFAAITQQFVEQRAYTDFAYERLDRADQTLSAGITRLERKLDRILALVVESQARRR
ncbi:MAG TPA: hypothetical protein VFT39_18440 [Vicinamibacterales bacterium]|nr:hypothetical protein [Vicinamibacterales bacterium]